MLAQQRSRQATPESLAAIVTALYLDELCIRKCKVSRRIPDRASRLAQVMLNLTDQASDVAWAMQQCAARVHSTSDGDLVVADDPQRTAVEIVTGRPHYGGVDTRRWLNEWCS